MDSTGMEVKCNNSAYGCTFASSSVEDMVNHFQSECAFHPVQCFKCSRMVPNMNFGEHYEQGCQDNSAPPYPAAEEAPDVGKAKASATMSQEQQFLRECVRECTSGVERLSSLMKDVAGDVAEVKVIKEKQQDLEAIVKGQGDVIQELSRSISVVVEKVDKVQEGVSGLVNRLDKDAGTIVECVENVDGSVKQCLKESKLGVEKLSRVIQDVAVDVAEVKLVRQEQDLEASVKQQGDLMKELGSNILMNAEKVNEVEQGVGTIVQRVENVDGLVKEVRELTGPLADQSKIHWYVENVSHYIEKANTEELLVRSNLFVIRGYSARLSFKVWKWEAWQFMELFFHLCRGPRDSMLQWPFRIPFILSLIHPNDASKTKQFKMTPSSTDPQCFEKPKSEINIGRGTPRLCIVEDAQDEGFIENDAVCFALTLHE